MPYRPVLFREFVQLRYEFQLVALQRRCVVSRWSAFRRLIRHLICAPFRMSVYHGLYRAQLTASHVGPYVKELRGIQRTVT